MKIEGRHLVMEDGTTYQYSGAGRTIGIDLSGSDVEITFGYDISIHPEDDLRGTNGLYGRHRKELANFMIAQWTAWRDAK